MSAGRPKWNGKIYLDSYALTLPDKWKSGKMIFVNSMSDLFHDSVPLDFILSVFETMKRTPQHTYQILTKRAERLSEVSDLIDWPDNVWMGVSVENDDYVYRIQHLRSVAARVRFLSLEPLLGPLHSLDLDGIDWVIAGGESGPGARAMAPSWVYPIRDMCLAKGVAFHFKQWGGPNKKKAGRLLDGRTWDEFPSSEPNQNRAA